MDEFYLRPCKECGGTDIKISLKDQCIQCQTCGKFVKINTYILEQFLAKEWNHAMTHE